MLDPLTLVQISKNLPPQSKLIFNSICKLYYSNNQKWEFIPDCTGCTVVCEEEPRTFVLKLISMSTYNTVWQHELYEGVTIQKLGDTFACFEADNGFVGMSFANECKSELEMFKTVVETVIKSAPKRQPEAKKQVKETKEPSSPAEKPQQQSGVKGFFAKLFGKKQTQETSVEKPQEPQLVIGSAKKDTFKHVSHVGFDGAGFSMENVPEEWQQMIGGNADLLQDKRVQKALTKTVTNFLKERQLDAVIKEEMLLDLSTPTTTTPPTQLPVKTTPLPPVAKRAPPAAPKLQEMPRSIVVPPTMGDIPTPPMLGDIPAPPSLGSIPAPPLSQSSIPAPPPSLGSIPTPPPTMGDIPTPPMLGNIPTPPPLLGGSIPALPSLGSIPAPPPSLGGSIPAPPSLGSLPVPSHGSTSMPALPNNVETQKPKSQDSNIAKPSFLADIVNLDKTKLLKPPAPPKPQETKKVLDINSLSQKDQVDLMTAIQFSIKNMKSKMSGDAEEEEEEEESDDW